MTLDGEIRDDIPKDDIRFHIAIAVSRARVRGIPSSDVLSLIHNVYRLATLASLILI